MWELSDLRSPSRPRPWECACLTLSTHQRLRWGCLLYALAPPAFSLRSGSSLAYVIDRHIHSSGPYRNRVIHHLLNTICAANTTTTPASPIHRFNRISGVLDANTASSTATCST